MTSRRINRFVETAGPAEGTGQGKDLQAIEKKHTLKEAIDLFRKERKGLEVLRKACKKAEDLLRSRQVGQNLGNLATLDEDSKMAIIVFTLEEPNNVCREFNSKSRSLTSSSWSSFQYKGMWLLLNKAILSHGTQSSSFTLYRGITALVDASSTYCFRQVASTSKKRNVAEDFSNGQGTLFIIEGSRYLGIKALSEFPEEEEYIISAFDTFKVTKVGGTNKCREICLKA